MFVKDKEEDHTGIVFFLFFFFLVVISLYQMINFNKFSSINFRTYLILENKYGFKLFSQNTYIGEHFS